MKTSTRKLREWRTWGTIESRRVCFQDREKNSWQSVQELPKYEDNCGSKDNRAWKHQIDEPKCNIQKESKMMGVIGAGGVEPPRITHTAATPQDSPNTTLDAGYNCRTVYPSNVSIESIDRSGVSYS